MLSLPAQYKRVEALLVRREITGAFASSMIYAARQKLGPPWHWREWKPARDLLIGTSCETCGAGQDAVLTLQHTFRHPLLQPYIDAAKEAVAALPQEPDWRLELRERMRAIKDDAVMAMRDCCPKCESLSIQYRKRAGSWICNSKKTGSYCAHVFEVPVQKMGFTAEEKKSIRRRKNRAFIDVAGQREHDWQRRAILCWLQDLKRYLTLEDTKTLCRRCAFLEDMTDLKPCLACGSAFSRSEEVCPYCCMRHEIESLDTGLDPLTGA